MTKGFIHDDVVAIDKLSRDHNEHQIAALATSAEYLDQPLESLSKPMRAALLKLTYNLPQDERYSPTQPLLLIKLSAMVLNVFARCEIDELARVLPDFRADALRALKGDPGAEDFIAREGLAGVLDYALRKLGGR